MLLTSDNLDEDIFIQKKDINGANHNDGNWKLKL